MEKRNRLVVPLAIVCLYGITVATGRDVSAGADVGAVSASGEAEEYYIDPVCGRKVLKDTPHVKQVNGKAYYFCSEACARVFKKEMVEIPAAKLIYVDPVCGCRVSEDTPHVAKYKDVTYYFCIQPCKNRFLASPEQFSCYCVEGEHCPHREGRTGEPCEQGPILGWGRWTHWGCPTHMEKFDFSY